MTSSWNSPERPSIDLSLITNVDLNENNLKELPEWVSECKNLQELHCEDNEIESLPDSIISLTELRLLNFACNQLKDLPKFSGSTRIFPKLKMLFCNDNKLKFLPDWIGSLRKLQYLYCRGNQIEQIPFQILKCINLIIFSCENVPPIITRFLNQNRDNIIKYNLKNKNEKNIS